MKYPFLAVHGQQAGDYLGLSLAGAVKIAPYPEECHQEALDSFLAAQKKNVAIRDDLRFYIFLCNDYCKNRYIDPNYPELTRLAAQYSIDAGTPVYLPPEDRVKVKFESKTSQKKPYEGNPYREPTHPPKKSVHAFPFSPSGKIDDIAEAIKIIGYISINLQGDTTAGVPDVECFTRRATCIIEQLISKNESYTLNIEELMEQTSKFIEYESEKLTMPEEDVKLVAQQAMAKFVPVLLKPLHEKGLLRC